MLKLSQYHIFESYKINIYSAGCRLSCKLWSQCKCNLNSKPMLQTILQSKFCMFFNWQYLYIDLQDPPIVLLAIPVVLQQGLSVFLACKFWHQSEPESSFCRLTSIVNLSSVLGCLPAVSPESFDCNSPCPTSPFF